MENVVKPPQNPTAARRYNVFDDAGISKPIMKEPKMFIDNVANSLQMAKCVKIQVIKYLTILPNAPPVPTNNIFFIIMVFFVNRL